MSEVDSITPVSPRASIPPVRPARKSSRDPQRRKPTRERKKEEAAEAPESTKTRSGSKKGINIRV